MLLSDNSDIMSYFEWSERVRVMINEGTLGFEERQMSPLLAPGSAAITMIPKYTQWHKYNNTSKYFCICESECNFIFDRFIKLSFFLTSVTNSDWGQTQSKHNLSVYQGLLCQQPTQQNALFMSTRVFYVNIPQYSSSWLSSWALSGPLRRTSGMINRAGGHKLVTVDISRGIFHRSYFQWPLISIYQYLSWRMENSMVLGVDSSAVQ